MVVHCVKHCRKVTYRMVMEERETALAVWSSSLMARRAVSIEWPAFNPDWRGSRRLFWMQLLKRYRVRG